MAVSYVRVIDTQLVGQEFKQNTKNFNIINENEDKTKSVKNDSFYQSNQYVGKDCLGRDLDLTYLIDKPNGYLQGKLSVTDDVDYYKFNIGMYRTLRVASEKYDLDFTITLDNVPEGCDYDLILYDSDGNQVGIGQDNGNGGKSVTVPNWNMENREYTVKVLAKDGSAVNADEYYHLSFQTQQAAEDNVLKQQIEEAQKYAGALRRKLHDGQDATEEKLALQQMEQSGISPIPSFEVSIGIDGKAEVDGIEDAAVKEKVESILNGFSGELIDTYISINASMQGMTKQEQYILKAAMGVEKFLQKATGDNVALADITVGNGRIKGLDAPLDKLLNDPGQNQTYLDYRADILAIKNYEKMQGNGLLGGFSARYTVNGKIIRAV